MFWTVAKWDLSGPGWYLSVPILVQNGKGTSGSINVWHCADTWSGEGNETWPGLRIVQVQTTRGRGINSSSGEEETLAGTSFVVSITPDSQECPRAFLLLETMKVGRM